MSNNTVPAFVIADNPTVPWPVVVALPAAGGKTVSFAFEGTFRLLSEDAYDQLLAKDGPTVETPAGDTGGVATKTVERSLKEVLAENARILPQLVVDWTVKNTAGVPIPIADLAKTLTGPYGRPLSVGLYRALYQIRYGMDFSDGGANAGNSASSPDVGAIPVAAAVATS